MLVCSFVCANRTRDRGCSKHPVFPAPSDKEGGKLSSKPRAISAARMRNYIHPSLRAQRSNPCRGTKKARHKERMDCFAALAMRRKEPSSSVGSFDCEDS